MVNETVTKTKTTKKTIPEPKILDISKHTKTTMIHIDPAKLKEKQEWLKKAQKVIRREVRKEYKEARILDTIYLNFRKTRKAVEQKPPKIEEANKLLRNALAGVRRLLKTERKVEKYAEIYEQKILPHLADEQDFVEEEKKEKIWIGNLEELTKTLREQVKHIRRQLKRLKKGTLKLEDFSTVLVTPQTSCRLARSRIDHLYAWQQEILKEIESKERALEPAFT